MSRRRSAGSGSSGSTANSNRNSNKNNNNRRSNSKRRRRKPKTSALEFWGDPAAPPLESPGIEVTGDPASAVRSLGPPPLSGQERAAEACFELVYDRAVGLAGALAAANGLLIEQRPEPVAAEPASDEDSSEAASNDDDDSDQDDDDQDVDDDESNESDDDE